MAELKHESLWARCGGTPVDRRNLIRLLTACVVWAVLFLGATWAIGGEVLEAVALRWAVAVIPTVAAIVVFFAYTRYLRETDELQRQVQLRALAVGFAAGWIAISGYPLLERLGAPVMDVGDYVAVMAVAFSITNVIEWSRYR